MLYDQFCEYLGLQTLCANGGGGWLSLFKQFPLVSDARQPPSIPGLGPPLSGGSESNCNKDKWNILVGSTYNPHSKTFKMSNGSTVNESSLPKQYRVLGSDSIVTMEFVPQRLSVYFDKPVSRQGVGGAVTKVTCG